MLVCVRVCGATQEDELGSLERGKKADFVVVSHRVDLDPALLAHHGPDQVWVDGRLRWHSAMGREVGARGKTCSC